MLQRQFYCILCGAYVGQIKHFHQIVCVEGLTEMVAEVKVELLLHTYPDDAVGVFKRHKGLHSFFVFDLFLVRQSVPILNHFICLKRETLPI